MPRELVTLPAPLAAAFAQQSRACANLGSAFTAAICEIVAERGLPSGATQERIAQWQGDPHGTGTAIALRLTGALHNLVLRGADAELAAVYPPNAWDKDTLEQAVFGAIERHDEAVCAFLDSAPQTNETGRAGMLLPALLTLAARHDLPMDLLELGASAGLNQNLAHFHYNYGGWTWGNRASPLHLKVDWRGGAFPHTQQQLQIATRRGCDIAPVAIKTEADRLHLMSYIWPDQTERLKRVKAALNLADAYPPVVDRSGAADWLAWELQTPPVAGHWRIIFHTIMWQYMPADEQARARGLIEQAGEDATSDTPLGWVRLEADGKKGSAGLYATIWHGSAHDGEDRLLARGDFHGRWIEWLG